MLSCLFQFFLSIQNPFLKLIYDKLRYISRFFLLKDQAKEENREFDMKIEVKILDLKNKIFVESFSSRYV